MRGDARDDGERRAEPAADRVSGKAEAKRDDMRIGRAPSLTCAKAKRAFRTGAGTARAVQRAHGIAALPSKKWRGERVYALRCEADFGKGPHVMHVSAGVLWSLLSLKRWRCPFHN